MRYKSTNKKAPSVTFREAILNGLAPDGGLYMPSALPRLPSNTLKNLNRLSFQDIANIIARCFIGKEMSRRVLRSIIDDTLNFKVPLVRLSEDTFVLELFNGPTLSFKDFGARFMARAMSYFVRGDGQELTVLVATSGDTGSAVAHGFLRVPGIRVVILYPKGRVSPLQEKQLTTMGHNITAVEIAGTFDDCQRLTKTAFSDVGLSRTVRLTSANSINIGRLIPQIFYYAWGCAQYPTTGMPLVYSVPSGNFGNLTAGLIGKHIGLPIAKFIAATNANRVVPEYLEHGRFIPRASKKTISNAMDVGNPSNFVRMLELYHHSANRMCRDMYGVSFTDTETRSAMRAVYRKYKYVLDPHGAIAYLGLERYRRISKKRFLGIALETAHPAKFKNVIEKTLHTKVALPHRLAVYAKRKEKVLRCSKDFETFKESLLHIA